MHGVQLSKQGVANMLPVLTGNTKLRALHFALASDAYPLHTLELDAVLSGCTALAELSISAARDWEYHLPSVRRVPKSHPSPSPNPNPKPNSNPNANANRNPNPNPNSRSS